MPVINNIPTTQYIGPKIIPHLWDPILWDSTIQYDALAVVQYEGVPYISRYVPPQGTLPTDTEYWVRWADFNAQMAYLQSTVETYRNDIDQNTANIAQNTSYIEQNTTDIAQHGSDIDNLNQILPISAFSNTNTIKGYIDRSLDNLNQILPISAFSNTNTIKGYIDRSFVKCFDNVAAMQACSNLAEGDICQTAGFHNANDGGGASYIIVTDASANGYDVIACGDVQARIILTSAMSVNQFGAVGNGSSDDTAAIQAAIDKQGFIVFDGTKSYKVTDTLSIKGETIIDLCGATIISTTAHLFFNFVPSDTFTAYDGNGNIIIKNGIIVGGSASFIHGRNITIENMRFRNTLNDHFVEICACTNFTVKNSSFVGMRNLEGSNAEYINIDPCNSSAFPWLDDGSVGYDDTVNDGVFILNNYLNIGSGEYAYMWDGIGVHYVPDSTQNHRNVIIDGNTIEGNPTYGVSIMGCSNSIVRNNKLNVRGWCVRWGYGNNNAIIDNYGNCSEDHSFSIGEYACDGLSIYGNVFKATSSTDENAGRQLVAGENTVLRSTNFIRLQKTTIGNSYTDAMIPFTRITKLIAHTGGVGAGTYNAFEINPMANRAFMVGESFPFAYIATDGTVKVGHFTIDSEISATCDVQLRELYVECDITR